MQIAYREHTGVNGGVNFAGGVDPSGGVNFRRGGGSPGGGSIVKLANRRGAMGNVGIYKEMEVIVEVKGCSHIGDANMEFLHA